jgi:hypothetical protein
MLLMASHNKAVLSRTQKKLCDSPGTSPLHYASPLPLTFEQPLGSLSSSQTIIGRDEFKPRLLEEFRLPQTHFQMPIKPTML